MGSPATGGGGAAGSAAGRPGECLFPRQRSGSSLSARSRGSPSARPAPARRRGGGAQIPPGSSRHRQLRRFLGRMGGGRPAGAGKMNHLQPSGTPSLPNDDGGHLICRITDRSAHPGENPAESGAQRPSPGLRDAIVPPEAVRACPWHLFYIACGAGRITRDAPFRTYSCPASRAARPAGSGD